MTGSIFEHVRWYGSAWGRKGSGHMSGTLLFYALSSPARLQMIVHSVAVTG